MLTGAVRPLGRVEVLAAGTGLLLPDSSAQPASGTSSTSAKSMWVRTDRHLGPLIKQRKLRPDSGESCSSALHTGSPFLRLHPLFSGLPLPLSLCVCPPLGPGPLSSRRGLSPGSPCTSRLLEPEACPAAQPQIPSLPAEHAPHCSSLCPFSCA